MNTTKLRALLTSNQGEGYDSLVVLCSDFSALLDRLDKLEVRLAAADELVDHILTSGAMNPELALAEAYERAGKGEV